MSKKKIKRYKRCYRPKRKNKAELFKALFHYWSVKLLDRTYPIIKDNRFNGHLITEYDYQTKKVVIRYNSRKLCRWSFAMIVSGVFHEIGHIMQGCLPYDTDEEKIFCEYDAEVYSLRMMKKYYTEKDIKDIVSTVKYCLKDKKWQQKYPIHYNAFKQIKQYQS